MSRPRPPEPTLSFVDEHCQAFRALFDDVRGFEHFKALHLGLLSNLPRKSLPAIARFLGLCGAQGLHHMLTSESIATDELRRLRTGLVRAAIGQRPLTLLVDETGDRKKGQSTDYVSPQYLGSLGKVDNGLVTVHVVALLAQVTFPLLFEAFKPEKRLKPGERHRSKVKVARASLDEVASWGLAVELVVADALYGEASDFIQALRQHRWGYAVAVRTDHAVWLPAESEVYTLPWQAVERHLADGEVEVRWAQEVVYGQAGTEPGRVHYFVLTSDAETRPAEQTSFVMTNLAEADLPAGSADAYGRRTYVEGGFRHMKTELGWHDWRLTAWAHVEWWYELVLSTFALVSLEALRRADVLGVVAAPRPQAEVGGARGAGESRPPFWRGSARVKHTLEDMRGFVQAVGAAVGGMAAVPGLFGQRRTGLPGTVANRAFPTMTKEG